MEGNPRRGRRALVAAALVAYSTGVAHASGVLTWTAPGDNGTAGTAARYDIRRSTQPITGSNFALADTVAGAPPPAAAGTVQSCPVALPQGGVTYYFAIKTADAAGNWSAISNVASGAARTTAVADGDPGAVRLDPPWPNPARSGAALRLVLPRAQDVEVEIFDAGGRHVRSLWSGPVAAGATPFGWNLRDERGGPVAAGVYLVRARIGAWVRTARVTVVH